MLVITVHSVNPSVGRLFRTFLILTRSATNFYFHLLIHLLIILPLNYLLSVKCQKTEHFPELVLLNQETKPQRDSMYKWYKQREKWENLHIWESGTSENAYLTNWLMVYNLFSTNVDTCFCCLLLHRFVCSYSYSNTGQNFSLSTVSSFPSVLFYSQLLILFITLQ